MSVQERLFNAFNKLHSHVLDENFLIFRRALMVKGIVIGLNAATIIVISSIFDPDGLAEFAVLSSAMALAVGTFRAPIEVLIQRSFQKDETGFVTFYSLSSLRFLFILSALAGACLFFATLHYSGYSTDVAGMALLSLGAMAGVLSGGRRGLLIVSHQTDRVDILDLIARPTFFLAAVVSYTLYAGAAEPALPIVFALSFVLVLSVPNIRSFRQLFANVPIGRAGGAPDWIKLVVSAALSTLRQNGDVILLASIVGGPIVGSYFILVRLTDILAFGNNYANLRYTHRFAKAVRDADGAARRAAVRAASGLSMAVTLAAAFPTLAFGYWVLPMIKASLAGLYLPFAILISAQVINGFYGPRGSFLASQWPGASLTIKLVTSAFGFALLYVLTVRFGLIGTAYAVAISTITNNILTAASFARLSLALSQKGA
jgi:O-antigen/teichoic acid export membrane protein